LIIVGCRLVLPPELEREMTVVEFALPGKEALGHVLEGIIESAGLETLSPEHQDQAIDAACGLTTIELRTPSPYRTLPPAALNRR
jgi:hypothetical protein